LPHHLESFFGGGGVAEIIGRFFAEAVFSDRPTSSCDLSVVCLGHLLHCNTDDPATTYHAEGYEAHYISYMPEFQGGEDFEATQLLYNAIVCEEGPATPATTGIGTILLILALAGSSAHFLGRRKVT
jgi:hypothetical protein